VPQTILARPLRYALSSTVRLQTTPYTFSLSKELPMTATATRHECVLNTLPTATMHANFDAPQTSTARQREIAANGEALNRESRRYQFLMSFLRVMSAFDA
jgi:hypothetical protein